MLDYCSTVEPGYKRTGYRRNLVITDENAATKFFYIIKPGYRRNLVIRDKKAATNFYLITRFDSISQKNPIVL